MLEGLFCFDNQFINLDISNNPCLLDAYYLGTHPGSTSTWYEYIPAGPCYSPEEGYVLYSDDIVIGVGTAVTGVALSESSLNLSDTGEIAILNATVQPFGATYQNVIWSSSNESVATVTGEGFVTPVSEGVAIIMVTTVDGGFTATCEVTVVGSGHSGWTSIGGDWYYYVNNEPKTGWLQDSGDWYYFGSDGKMKIEWQKISGKWYYFNSYGEMQTGWQKISNTWYYFNSSGAMQTGWQKISNKWYYFENSGAMVTGWKKLSGTWYYFESSGAMKTGWLKLSGKWYYFESSGAMVTGSRTISGKVYKFNSSGVCLNP